MHDADEFRDEEAGSWLDLSKKVLTDLIALLKGEMSRFQSTQKQEEEKARNCHDKKVKKIEYDMKQIMTKHNEEIAKISLLKEEANGLRS